MEIKDVIKSFLDDLEKIGLDQLKIKYLGKESFLNVVSRELKNKSEDEKKELGREINELRTLVTTRIKELEDFKKAEEIKKLLDKEEIDIYLPEVRLKEGSIHPLNQVIMEIEDLFIQMGFDVYSGPELEEDLYNFQLLNISKDHPARDMQDSFYIDPEKLLRTHTSPVQARTMVSNIEKTPIRMICPGNCYRRDEDDARHSHQFMQVEGLVVDENISLADLKGILELFIKKLLGEETKLRFRPSYFPFTEPSYEIDFSCFKCHGKGCSFCKNTGWIEILGAGMVNPNVLKACGYDPNKYSGYAFGVGIDRITMLKHEIDDIRYFYENDIRFLNQFRKEME